MDADPGYLRQHHNKMQANWHQYIECTNMRVGMLNHTQARRNLKETE
ncbi:hypothetical protein MTR67_007910 [Solanum verrucosum]|uniref:Late blight resistance protein n=1 Tax=Solanum verrucosum TaxID=315347 RepID=A0AAF0Q2U5_SOLVR|nr:hypothetical protein MTR67_007910 [Solanum verrucosum]